MKRECSASIRVGVLVTMITIFTMFGLTQSVLAYQSDVYDCSSLRINLDGDFGDWPASVSWHKVSRDMGWDRPGEGVVLPVNDRDASFEFACITDDGYLYVAVKIRDDKKMVDEDGGDEVHKDDSIEIYIDGDNSKSSEYEPDVSQITIGRYNIGSDPARPLLNSWTGMNGQGKAATDTGTMAAVVDTDHGWAVETAIPLASFGIDPVAGAIIGFNIQLNDDDDGGNHDHKLSWSKAELKGNNASFKDPSVFGELRLSSVGSVEAEERMKTEEKAKVIEGVDRLKWGNGQESTFMGALTATMRAMGEDISYDYLMGVSGAAFRLHFHQPGWCPSSPDATCGFDHSTPALQALGYTARPIHSDKSKPEEVKEVRDAVVKSIDNGRPVVAIDLIGSPDWGVIVGYSEEGEEFLCRTYYDRTEEYSRAQKWPWVTMIIEQKGDTPSRRESILQSLKIAQEIANTEKYEDYASGFSAYKSWIADLLDDSRFEDLSEEELSGMVHVNAWCYSSLGDARGSAVKYLRSVAGDFGEEGKAHLTKAADVYDKIIQKLMDGWKYAPYPHQLKDGERWTKEMRHAEADVLKEVLALEREAVDELRAAYDKEKDRMEKLDELDFAPRATSHMGALEGCLKYLGIDVSPGWLFGSTGHAFIMNIDTDLCGSGPHCWSWGNVNRLGKNIGYKAEAVYTNVNKNDFSQMQEKAWDFARKSIDDGFPCYGWHYDFMVINGYDDNGYLLSGPVDDAPSDWRKFGADAVGFLEIWSIRPGQKADDETTIKAALSFAVSFNEQAVDSRDAGLSGYDNWITGLESGKGDAFGGAYNTAIWAECRRYAVEFLEEANQRTEKKYDSLFQSAIEQYRLVSDNLNEVEKLFPYKGATEDEWKQNMGDSQRRQKAVEHLKAAKTAEAAGLEALGKIISVL